jgi:hypothetical protein
MSRSSFIVAGLELEMSDREQHEGKQASKWDDVRHHLVYKEGDEIPAGKKIGDPKLDKKIEGFKTMSEASGCAARMRNAWGFPIKSYTNLKSGKFGICFKDADDEEEAPASPAAVLPDPPPAGVVLAQGEIEGLAGAIDTEMGNGHE